MRTFLLFKGKQKSAPFLNFLRMGVNAGRGAGKLEQNLAITKDT